MGSQKQTMTETLTVPRYSTSRWSSSTAPCRPVVWNIVVLLVLVLSNKVEMNAAYLPTTHTSLGQGAIPSLMRRSVHHLQNSRCNNNKNGENDKNNNVQDSHGAEVVSRKNESAPSKRCKTFNDIDNDLRSSSEGILKTTMGIYCSIVFTLSVPTLDNYYSGTAMAFSADDVATTITLSAASTAGASATNPLERLLEAQETLDKLLDNWQRATIDCTYADVPRELLEQKNKELLLEKASTFALFDKSVSVETCKTTNRIVRDYLGVTGKGPLVGIDKQIRKGLDYLPDPDDLENYVAELEQFSQSYSKAASLSYAAGIADFDSVNNFSKDDVAAVGEEDGNSNLVQTKKAIEEAKQSLGSIIVMLQREL